MSAGYKSSLINLKLGVKIYREDTPELVLNRFTAQEIKHYQIDDLVIRLKSGFMYPTPRLIELSEEIWLDHEEQIQELKRAINKFKKERDDD